MRCPKDIAPRAFRALLDEVGDGLDLEQTTRVGAMRYFRFRAAKQRDGMRRGDLVEYPVPCKFKARK